MLGCQSVSNTVFIPAWISISMLPGDLCLLRFWALTMISCRHLVFCTGLHFFSQNVLVDWFVCQNVNMHMSGRQVNETHFIYWYIADDSGRFDADHFVTEFINMNACPDFIIVVQQPLCIDSAVGTEPIHPFSFRLKPRHENTDSLLYRWVTHRVSGNLATHSSR